MRGRTGPEVGLQLSLMLVHFFHVNNFTLNPFDLDLRIKEVLSVLCNAISRCHAISQCHFTINKRNKSQYLESVVYSQKDWGN